MSERSSADVNISSREDEVRHNVTPCIVTPRTTIPYISYQKINVLYECHEILSETMLSLEAAKVQNLVDAKREFNERKDINFYITADDLLKIQNTKGKISIKLAVDYDNTSTRSEEHTSELQS